MVTPSTELVRERHEDRAARAARQILLGDAFGGAFEELGESRGKKPSTGSAIATMSGRMPSARAQSSASFSESLEDVAVGHHERADPVRIPAPSTTSAAQIAESMPPDRTQHDVLKPFLST